MNSGNPFVNLYAKTDSFLIILKLTLINGVLFFPFCYFFLNEFYYIYNHTIIITNQFYIISFPNPQPTDTHLNLSPLQTIRIQTLKNFLFFFKVFFAIFTHLLNFESNLFLNSTIMICLELNSIYYFAPFYFSSIKYISERMGLRRQNKRTGAQLLS